MESIFDSERMAEQISDTPLKGSLLRNLQIIPEENKAIKMKTGLVACE
ncbi:MAG: hypothetical protein NWF04_05330 [Candidatus Bathyarchaeota archaeon]|nr:hypothetical protein [Candidatus Bathyarchaeota archaeon]